MHFPKERYRIELALAMHFARYTGNRPVAIVHVKYEDIKMSFVKTGDHPFLQPVIDITFKATKNRTKGMNKPQVLRGYML